MRHSRALEIRELIIRCVSQMVLARVANVKSGWKSMFMVRGAAEWGAVRFGHKLRAESWHRPLQSRAWPVLTLSPCNPVAGQVFTTAASDESPQIVRLAFDTVEKIVREHFHYITGGWVGGRVVEGVGCQARCTCARSILTLLWPSPAGLPTAWLAETETTTFTDCVNCLIAFTNNPHSLDVSLNAIAFLRFCAMALAEGSIGDVSSTGQNQLVEGLQPAMGPRCS